ncbi:MAG: MarR family winged helix-turn-helix transcriptional regulator [Geminicoccaceae bacterium]
MDRVKLSSGARSPLFLRADALDHAALTMLMAARDLERLGGDAAGGGPGVLKLTALLLLRRQDDFAQCELMSLMGLSKQAASRLAKQLVACGWVVPMPDGADGRKRRLRLTELGARTADRIGESLRARFGRVFRDHGEDAVDGFKAVLSSLLEPVTQDYLSNTLGGPDSGGVH